jgi:Flp pilus assembly protein CpaB
MKFLKNRFFLGILCIAAGLSVSLMAIPKLMDKSTTEQIEVVRVKTDIPAGSLITDDQIELIAIDKNALPSMAIDNTAEVNNKYASADLFQGDILTSAKLVSEKQTKNYLETATEKGMRLVSITIPSLSAGVSGQIKPGDIVTVMALLKTNTADSVQTLQPDSASLQPAEPDESSTETIPADPDQTIENSELQQQKLETQLFPSLQFLEVFSLSAADGSSAIVEPQLEDDNKNALPVTLTVFVDEKQALLLAELEQKAIIHLSRVSGTETAANYIDPAKLVMATEGE